MDDVVFKWVGTLGFPVAAAVAMGFALYRLGSKLVNAHAGFLEAQIAHTAALTESFKALQAALPRVCQARCPGPDTTPGTDRRV